MVTKADTEILVSNTCNANYCNNYDDDDDDNVDNKTMGVGPINNAGLEFLSDLERRISQVSKYHRDSAFLFQRLSVLTGVKSGAHNLRPKGHTYELPRCDTEMYKNSFVPRCLYRHV